MTCGRFFRFQAREGAGGDGVRRIAGRCGPVMFTKPLSISLLYGSRYLNVFTTVRLRSHKVELLSGSYIGNEGVEPCQGNSATR